MEALGEFCCRDCSMTFHSVVLLEKHKTLFCIGCEIGDPLALRQGPKDLKLTSDGKWIYPIQARTPDLIRLRAQKKHLRKKTGRVNDGEARAEKIHPVGIVADSIVLQNLTDEFHKLRMSIEDSLTNIPKLSNDATGGDRVSEKQLGHRERMKEMNEQHEHQMAEIQAHSLQLEKQREELARQLGALAGQGSTAHLESLLLDIREKEERNEGALEQLRDHIAALQPQQGYKEAFPSSDPKTTEDKKEHHVTFDLISSVDGPLSTQIRALRLAYMQSGGADPAVLSQMHDLQSEAHTLEQVQPYAVTKAKKKKTMPVPRAQKSEVFTVQQENQRLEEEILRIQRMREKQLGDEVVGTEFQLIQREHIHHMAGIQHEIESLRRELERAKEDPRDRRQAPPPPPPLPFPAQPAMHPLVQIHAPPVAMHRPNSSQLARHVLDPMVSLGPAPYDSAAGFVIFYDLALGVDTTLRALCLVAALYDGARELGRPTSLPPVQCQPGGNLPYAHNVPPGNYATLSAKQPVPRMQPSPSLSLVVEVQTIGGLDSYGQEIQRLVSRGWARLELFDPHNQVQSGHWRVPVRSLPVRPSLSSAQLNSVPQVGNMELCLRVVNARDGDLQTLAKSESSNLSQYRYPIMMSSHPATLQVNPPPPLALLQPQAANPFHSLLPYNNHEDPPPVEEFSQSKNSTHILGPLKETGDRVGLGIIVDRVTGAPQGEGCLRLTGYSQKTGKVIMCGDSGLHCSTYSARTSIEYGNVIFGEQQIKFGHVFPQDDMILMLRFYNLPGGSRVPFTGLVKQKHSPPWEQECLVGNLAERGELMLAWGVLRMTRALPQTQWQKAGQINYCWNTGIHFIPLYLAPVPSAMALTTMPEESLGMLFEPNGNMVARLHIHCEDLPACPIPLEPPLPTSMTPNNCFQLSVDQALNLPWSAFTLGLCSLNPPGAFYNGPCWVAHDYPTPILQLDPSSSQSAPTWKDGFKYFQDRIPHPYLTAIIHLYAVSIVDNQNTKASPGFMESQIIEDQADSPLSTLSIKEQCWAAVPVFTEGHCNYKRHQLPLYQGCPSKAVLSALAKGNCNTVLKKLQQTHMVQILPGASVLLRLGVGQELATSDEVENRDKSQLPVEQLDSYNPQIKSPAISQLIPTSNISAETFINQLASKYMELVYQDLQASDLRPRLQLMSQSTERK